MTELSYVLDALNAAAVSSNLTSDVVDQRELIAQAARGAGPAPDFASLTFLESATGELQSTVATDPLARKLDELQFELRQGPGLDALAGDNFVVTGDVAQDARWPLFGAEAAAVGVRSMLAICLVGGQPAVGLNLYSTDRDAFVEPLDDVWLVASFARVVLGYAPASALTGELLDFTPIGSATRAVMDAYALDAVAAFVVLLNAASRAEELLYVVVDRLICAVKAGLIGAGAGRPPAGVLPKVADPQGRSGLPGMGVDAAIARGLRAGARAEELRKMRTERRPAAKQTWQARMALARQRFDDAQERARAASLAAAQRHLEAAYMHDRAAKALASRGDIERAERHRRAARLERKLASEGTAIDSPAASPLSDETDE